MEPPMMGGKGSRYVPQSWGCFVKIKHEHFPPWELAGPKCSASLCLPVLLLLHLLAAIVQKKGLDSLPLFLEMAFAHVGRLAVCCDGGFPFLFNVWVGFTSPSPRFSGEGGTKPLQLRQVGCGQSRALRGVRGWILVLPLPVLSLGSSLSKSSFPQEMHFCNFRIC